MTYIFQIFRGNHGWCHRQFGVRMVASIQANIPRAANCLIHAGKWFIKELGHVGDEVKEGAGFIDGTEIIELQKMPALPEHTLPQRR